MNPIAATTALFSLIGAFTSIATYSRAVRRGEVPARVTGMYIKLTLAITLGAAAIVWSITSAGSLNVIAAAPAILAITISSAFLWVLSQRRTPVGDLKVTVGDALLPFEATTSEGNRFHTDELAGQRVLLKFFRGSW